MTSSMLAFYQQHQIAPVRQDVTDLQAHCARRAALYRSLGLVPSFIRDRRVLEVGPGTGENARYTASLSPSVYALIEPNPTAARALHEEGFTNIIQTTIQDAPVREHYDLVLCEGVLGLSGTDPRAILEAAWRHVAVGGVLVLTCIDAISDHAEIVRRAMAQYVLDRSLPLDGQIAQLRPMFTPHLQTLCGMTRGADDWIADNLLNPASVGPTFSIPDACDALDGRAELLGCSPRFLMDWRWYKASSSGLGWVKDAYWTQAHNLLDYRVVQPPRSREDNQRLDAECRFFRAQLRLAEQGQADWPTYDPIDPSWFGRGQQYLSFVRTEPC